MTQILTFDLRFPGRDLALHASKNPSSLGDETLPAPGVILDGHEAVARVDHGRWIADCPWEDCNGAEFVSFEAPLFFCCECRNAAVDHVPIRVRIPGAQFRAQIEAYLVARPIPANRNWFPDETVKQLRDENRKHGIRLA